MAAVGIGGQVTYTIFSHGLLELRLIEGTTHAYFSISR